MKDLVGCLYPSSGELVIRGAKVLVELGDCLVLEDVLAKLGDCCCQRRSLQSSKIVGCLSRVLRGRSSFANKEQRLSRGGMGK